MTREPPDPLLWRANQGKGMPHRAQSRRPAFFVYITGMESRKGIDAAAIGLMIALCLCWGLQQVAIKAIAEQVPPLFQVALRSGMAAILVSALMFARKERLGLGDGTWKPGILVGILFALEFLFIGEALRFTSASHTVVFLYTAPIFAALGLQYKLPSERLRPIQWAGIGISFAGILTAFYARDPEGGGTAPASIMGDILALMAGLSWGATTVVIRCSRLSGTSATRTLLYQLAGAFAILMITALATGQTGFRPTPMAWASLLFQGVIVSFASFLVWFWMLRKYLASRLGTLSFMSPLFGVTFAIWLLDEPLDATFLIGSLLVLGGILLVTGTERKPSA